MAINGRAKPLPYQKQGVRRIEKFGGRVLLADEMGLGKTLQTLWALKRNPDWLPALIVCPASVKYQWEHEALRHVGMRAAVCEGKKPPRSAHSEFNIRPPLTIINYDILHHWTHYLSELDLRTVVFDECQYLQNSGTKRTQASQEVAWSVPHVLALSGTPLTNRPSDLWPTLNILWPDNYPSFWSYAQEFCSPRFTRWGWKFDGSSNLDKLHQQLISNGMIRRRKSDVLHDLPDKVRYIMPCELSRPKEYAEAADDFMRWLKKNKPHKVRSASRAVRLTRLGYLLRLAAKLKIKGVVDWANRFLEETDEKLILYAVHKKAIDVLKRRVRAKSVVIDGSITGKRRQNAVDQFQGDKRTRLLIGNLQAGGVGLNLTAASTIGMAEIAWKPAAHLQAEKRIDRIGQKQTCWVYYLIATGTIEEDLCRLLQRKQKDITAVIDGGQTPDNFNLYDELLNIIERRI